MTNNQIMIKNAKRFDLEERTTQFAKQVVRLCLELSKNSMNNRIIDQVIGSAGSIGANYREANDSIGEKDFLQKLKISRREAKEALHWLELMVGANPQKKSQIDPLKQEATELIKILSAIINKLKLKFHNKITNTKINNQ